MENQHNNERDSQGAEEFTDASPNSQPASENPVQKPIPEYTDAEKKRADTDPNRYANISNPAENETQHAAGDYDRSDYKEGDQPVQNEPTHYSTDDERRLSAEIKHDVSENNEEELKSSIDKQQFFDGL